MAVSDITGMTWTIGRFNHVTDGEGWDGNFINISNDQLIPYVISIEATAQGSGIGTYHYDFYITDPAGIVYAGKSDTTNASDGQSSRTELSVTKMGAYFLKIIVSDGGSSQDFTHTINTITQYDSGGGVMMNIPVTNTGEAQPPWEWLPAAGYYNRGDGVCVSGTSPSPLNSYFHCDLITRQCRPKYLGSPMACPVLTIGSTAFSVMTRVVPSNRKIPANLLAHKQSANQSTCWCWAIKPRQGGWEGYTSLNRDITLPEYTDEMGNVVPAMTYLCSYGIQPTAMPVRLTLAKNATDVTVLAFDRAKLQQQFYVGAEFEVFEINFLGDLNERWVGSAGLLGNTKITDNTATIELTPWGDLANRPLGREVNVICDVGVLIDEEFGTGRCRNEKLNDGPLKADWTVTLCTEATGSTNMSFWVRVRQDREFYSPDLYNGLAGVTAKSGNAIPANWHLHLREGKVLFTSGPNAGVERDIKTAWTSYPAYPFPPGGWFGMNIILSLPLPYIPTAYDTFEITAGCRRTKAECMFFNNIANFRGFPYVPGKEGVIRRYEEN